jgi:hypothetical protein
MKHRALFMKVALLLVTSPLVMAAPTNQEGSKAEGKPAPAATSDQQYAKNTFERLKKLEGKWVGRSTKGWTEAITFKTIAQGSVIHESSFDAHPNETMATMYHLDGNRLLLTHYCVSKTQPRLQATGFEEDGRKVTFTFVDATNLASRDKGHMDKVVFNFIDEDHFTSQWTWYQAGKEQWLEEIRYERAK